MKKNLFLLSIILFGYIQISAYSIKPQTFKALTQTVARAFSQQMSTAPRLTTQAQAHARVIETPDICTVLHHVYDTHHHKEILVVFDIDNTVAHVPDCFGGDEWFTAMVNKRVAEGMAINTAISEVFPTYFAIQQKVWLEPVQLETPKMIQFLQDVGIPVMALTSRSFKMIQRTFEQLAHIDVDFSRGAPTTDSLDLTMMNIAHHEGGIIFSGNNNKGELILAFFDAIGYNPQKVIFVDDKMKYVEQVGDALAQRDIAYVGIRYSRDDERAAQFKLEDYQQRLKEFVS